MFKMHVLFTKPYSRVLKYQKCHKLSFTFILVSSPCSQEAVFVVNCGLTGREVKAELSTRLSHICLPHIVLQNIRKPPGPS
jgi:hypothetical protein